MPSDETFPPKVSYPHRVVMPGRQDGGRPLALPIKGQTITVIPKPLRQRRRGFGTGITRPVRRRRQGPASELTGDSPGAGRSCSGRRLVQLRVRREEGGGNPIPDAPQPGQVNPGG